MELELSINGVIESLDIAPGESLLTLLRREGYYSVKQGCETGECGVCTVLVDGVARPGCVMLAAQAGGCTLTTVESLGSSRHLHPLQQAFIEVGAVQCGFCTPGMLLSATALLKSNPHPTENEVRDALSGNLCRCGGYEKPVQAVLRAAAMMRGEAVAPLEYSSSGVSNTGKQQAVRPEVGATAKLPAVSATPTAARSDNQLQVVGRSVAVIDAGKLVSGKAAFATDISPRNMLYGRILTSPHAHALIRAINVSQAKALPGVHAVLTYKDVPRVAYSSVERSGVDAGPCDQYSLDYKVRYVGDRVAAVAAETPEVAEQALSLVEVDYEVLPAVLGSRQALEGNAPPLHPEAESRGIYDVARNVAARIHTESGDVETAFAASDLVVEDEYIVPLQQPTPLENHSVITYFDEDDYLVVRTGTQIPHYVRRTLASILNIPARCIRVVRPDVGGDFGVRQELVLEDICSLLTLATNRPVMLAYSRAEELRSSRVSQHYILRIKTGVKRDGTIVANQLVQLASTGAYATHPLITQNRASFGALALYPCPDMRFAAEVLYTNMPPSGALRGYGAQQEFFALESHMDDIARQLGMDALELRRKNLLRSGDEYSLQQALNAGRDTPGLVESSGPLACLRAVEEKLRWREMRGRVSNGHVRRGVGIALASHGNHPGESNGDISTSGAIIKLNVDGSFDVFAAANGGASTTLLAQVAAEVLGVAIDDILMHTSDTSTLPVETGASGSATFYISGGAVQKAAEQVRRQLLSVAGRMLGVLPEALKISAGVITAPNRQSVTITQVAEYALYVENRHIMTTASWKSQHVPLSFTAQGVEIEVDTETGEVHVLKTITAIDAGRVMNPQLIEGQVQGSTTRGLSAAVCEELFYDHKGSPLTTNLSEYLLSLPTSVNTVSLMHAICPKCRHILYRQARPRISLVLKPLPKFPRLG